MLKSDKTMVLHAKMFFKIFFLCLTRFMEGIMTLSLVHTWMLFDNMLTSYFFREHPRIMNEQRIVPTQFKGEIQLFQKKTMKHLGKCF